MENFELEWREEKISVDEISIGKNKIFRVAFQSNKSSLVISRAKDAEGEWFWTSIPEGRLELAEEIGKLVEAHLKKNK